MMLEPRIAKLGPSAKNYYLERPLNESYLGRFGLFWVVWFRRGLERVVLLVDAKNGGIVSATYEQLLPPLRWSTFLLKPNFSVTEGLEVRDVELGVSPRLLGQLGVEDAKLVIKNVLILKPGSLGSIGLTIKPLNVRSDLILSFSVRNPLPGQEIPEGLEVVPPSSVIVERGGPKEVRLELKSTPECPEGTWLIEVDCSTRILETGEEFVDSRCFLLVSVWNGKGPWPFPYQLLRGLVPES